MYLKTRLFKKHQFCDLVDIIKYIEKQASLNTVQKLKAFKQ